jgi:uncharacterized protein (DUF2252 family)
MRAMTKDELGLGISAGRRSALEIGRTRKMARSAHAYVRGNTIKFYEWLLSGGGASVPEGPPVWICGDCHVGNLGPLADADGRIDVQIRDLDQTTIGNPAHDLIRLGLSLASAARGSDLPGVTTARMMENMVDGYSLALHEPELEDAVPEPNVIKIVKRRAFGRKWRHLARERLQDVTPNIPLGDKFWPLEPDEREALFALISTEEVRRLVLALNPGAHAQDLHIADAAYWVKGCSSLGYLRYAVLVQLREGVRKRDLAMLDVKEAVIAAAPTAPGVDVPAHNGERVVAGAKALSPNLGERMMAANLLGQPVVLRELLPQDLKLETDQFTRSEAVLSARYLAYVVGLAHARQMNRGDRQAWRRELEKNHRGALEAPHWLWSSIVHLAARHEEGYLEHCRRYALTNS